MSYIEALLKNEWVAWEVSGAPRARHEGSPHPYPRPQGRGSPRRRTGSGARHSKALPGPSPRAYWWIKPRQGCASPGFARP